MCICDASHLQIPTYLYDFQEHDSSSASKGGGLFSARILYFRASSVGDILTAVSKSYGSHPANPGLFPTSSADKPRGKRALRYICVPPTCIHGGEMATIIKGEVMQAMNMVRGETTGTLQMEGTQFFDFPTRSMLLVSKCRCSKSPCPCPSPCPSPSRSPNQKLPSCVGI